MTGPSEYSRYLSSLTNNQHMFLQEHSDSIHAFERVFANFTALREILKSARDANNKTHVGLWPFLTLMQRQSAIAFDGLACYQAFTAWASLRPGLEAVLMMGKWVDDRQNADIWQKREDDKESRKLYSRTYEGQALRSRSLPGSDRIQTVLKLSNDDYMHMNRRYYDRHLSVLREGRDYRLEIQFFDTETEHTAHLYAMLHLLFVIQDAVLAMFTALFASVSLETVGLAEFEGEFEAKVRRLLREHPEHKPVIGERGLWHL